MAIGTVNPIFSGVLFFVAAIMEIGGGYLVWLWIREKKTIALALLGGIILFVYGIIPTLQPVILDEYMRLMEEFYNFFDKMGKNSRQKKPDRYENWINCCNRTGIIFYSPR